MNAVNSSTHLSLLSLPSPLPPSLSRSLSLLSPPLPSQAAHNQKTNPNPEHHYPGYIWITFGWYQENWWRESGADSSSLPCSDEDLEPFLRNTFSIQLGNNSVDRTAATDVKLVSQLCSSINLYYPVYIWSAIMCCVILCYRQLLNLREE